MSVYTADPDRYSSTSEGWFRRVGHSGLKLPRVSLGFWHNFGDDKPLETQRAIMRRAFDRGVTHFDLANNYGPRAPRRRTRGAFSRRISRPTATS